MKLQDMSPEEQQNEIRALIAYYDERGTNWISIVGYHTAIFNGLWPTPRPQRRSVRPKARGAL